MTLCMLFCRFTCTSFPLYFMLALLAAIQQYSHFPKKHIPVLYALKNVNAKYWVLGLLSLSVIKLHKLQNKFQVKVIWLTHTFLMQIFCIEW